MSWKGASAGIAVVGASVVAACSDAPTSPTARTAFVPQSRFAVVGEATIAAPVPATELRVCKAGNVGGNFTITWGPGGGGTGNPTVIDQNGGAAGNQLTLNPGAGGAANCILAAIDQGDAGQSKGDFFTVAEDLAPGVTTQRTCYINDGNTVPDTCPPNFFINTAHGWTVVFTNTAPEPPDDACDFSTFGGFVLSPNNISYGGNAGAIVGGQAYGSLNFKNHTTGDHIHVMNVTGYGHPTSGALSGEQDSRFASGKGTINGAGSYDVEFRFLDNGEPGKNDKVWLRVNGNVLIPEMTVDGGNVQLHVRKNCKKAPKAEKH